MTVEAQRTIVLGRIKNPLFPPDPVIHPIAVERRGFPDIQFKATPLPTSSRAVSVRLTSEADIEQRTKSVRRKLRRITNHTSVEILYKHEIDAAGLIVIDTSPSTIQLILNKLFPRRLFFRENQLEKRFLPRPGY